MHHSAVGWLGGIDPRHRRRIIAAAIAIGCEKMREGSDSMRKGIVPMERWNPKMLNPNGTYAESSIENVSNRKNEMTPT
jgi:hypothetical protein